MEQVAEAAVNRDIKIIKTKLLYSRNYGPPIKSAAHLQMMEGFAVESQNADANVYVGSEDCAKTTVKSFLQLVYSGNGSV